MSSQYEVNEESILIKWVMGSQNLNQFDFLILPGSKQTIKDQQFLRVSGLSKDIKNYSTNKGNIFGICGGLQMLGTILQDPFFKEGSKVNLEQSIKGIGVFWSMNEPRRSFLIFLIPRVEWLSRHARSCISSNKAEILSSIFVWITQTKT